MRPDKAASLRKRLHRGGDAMDFTALLQGVSTLEDAAPPDEPVPAIEAGEEPAAGTPEQPPAPDLPGAEQRDPASAAAAAPPPVPAETDAALPGRRMRAALANLGAHLAHEAGSLAAALRAGDIEEAGVCLAKVNQALMLIGTVDPTGDLARQCGAPGAPPAGRAWPRPVWSVVEFAESPLSGLLPEGADSVTVRELLYAAWGYGPSPAAA